MDPRPLVELHRLAHEGLSVRKIAKTLGLSRPTPSTYLAAPTPPRPRRTRSSQLDLFQDASTHRLEPAPKVSAVVLRQRLAAQGGTGGLPLVRPSLTPQRPASPPQRAFIRCASAPGAQCQIAWGHFGSIA
jgi:transposase